MNDDGFQDIKIFKILRINYDSFSKITAPFFSVLREFEDIKFIALLFNPEFSREKTAMRTL